MTKRSIHLLSSNRFSLNKKKKRKKNQEHTQKWLQRASKLLTVCGILNVLQEPNNSRLSNVFNVVTAEYAATRKETAQGVFIKHEEGAIQAVNRDVTPEMHENFSLLCLIQKPVKLN